MLKAHALCLWPVASFNRKIKLILVAGPLDTQAQSERVLSWTLTFVV